MKTLTVHDLVQELSQQKGEIEALLERGYVGLVHPDHAETASREANERFENWRRELAAIDRVLERIGS